MRALPFPLLIMEIQRIWESHERKTGEGGAEFRKLSTLKQPAATRRSLGFLGTSSEEQSSWSKITNLRDT